MTKISFVERLKSWLKFKKSSQVIFFFRLSSNEVHLFPFLKNWAKLVR